MVDIYLISKTEFSYLKYSPEYILKESRDVIKTATKEEFDAKSENVYMAYKVGPILAFVLSRLPPDSGRWIVDFDENHRCDMSAVGSIGDNQIILGDSHIIPFTFKVPILIYQTGIFIVV